eukprot:366569-Chlamydomonas_euryale.AAC.11
MLQARMLAETEMPQGMPRNGMKRTLWQSMRACMWMQISTMNIACRCVPVNHVRTALQMQSYPQ